MSEEIKRMSLVRKEVQLVLDDPNTGEERKYVIVEMTGLEREKHLTSIGKRTVAGVGKAGASIRDFIGLQTGMIARCLFEVESDAVGTCTRRAVTGKEVAEFPSSVVGVLHQMCIDINGMNPDKGEDGKEADEEGKND